jgi:hypothetical protein
MCSFICYGSKDSGNIFVMPIENCILAQNKIKIKRSFLLRLFVINID